MANITVSTSSNLDDAANLALGNSENITIDSGATLTINSDNRWSQQAATPELITISSTTGGLCLLDGRDVWWLPYDGGTGNVPSLGTPGVQNCTGGTSAATGEFLGVFTALGVVPSTAGGAMPATGFLKFRSKVGTFTDNETVSLPGGASVVVNSASGGQRGWLSVVMEEIGTAAITVPRLGEFRVRGDWFELGTTNGADDQTFQFPVQDRCPAIQIETASGSGVYEWWLNAGDRWGAATVVISQDARGKFFGDTTGGVITIARRASNACGFKPPSGCRVRIPNVILSATTTASGFTTLSVNATLGTRPEFVTTSAGVIDIQYALSNWAFTFTNAYAVTIAHAAWADNCTITEPATPVSINNAASGFYTINGQHLTVQTAYLGGTITDFRACRRDSSSGTTQTISFDDIAGWTLLRCISEMLSSTAAVTRGANSVRAMQMGRCADSTLTDCVTVGAGTVIQNSSGITINNQTYCDLHNSGTSSTNPVSAFSGSGNSTIRVTGFNNLDISGIETHPYTAVLAFTNGVDLKVRGIGTSGAPYDGARNSSANGCGSLSLGGNLRNYKIQRCYAIRMRTAVIQDNNEDQNWTVANVVGDYADNRTPSGTNRLTHGLAENFSGTNATSSFGTHWLDYFTAATTGAIQIRCNEPTATTTSQCAATGTARFDGAGGVSVPTVADTVTWTTPRRILGHTAFQNVAPTISGANTGNLTLEYQVDTGSGYGSWKTLTAGNLSAESISPTTGFLLKVRATVAVGNAGNLLQRILIPTVTTASDQLTLYPLNNPVVGYEDTQSGSTLSIWNDGSSAFLTSGTHSSGDTLATPDWSSDYTAVLRLRKAGWQPVENTITIDEDGQTIPVVQSDYSTVPDTDPGALGITITNHGASPVSWQSKSWSITITTTNDSLTAAQVANWISYNIAQLATWNSFSGHAWPEMIQPDGTGFKTVRGRLMGSAGATLKGVRVVRSDGTTAVAGFTTMMADDGTTYAVPSYLTAQVTGIISGSRLQVYNVTSATEIYNGTPGTSWSLSYLEGAEFAAGESVRIRVTRTNGAAAWLPINTTLAASAAGWSMSVSQEADEVYNALAIDGSSVTGFAADYAADEVNVTVASNFNLADLYAWWAYNLTTSQGIAEFVGGLTAIDVGNFRINNATVDIYIDNTTATNLRQLDNRRIYRADEAYPVKSSGGGGIDVVWRNTILIAETGVSGLTSSESAQLAKLDSITVAGGLVAADVQQINGNDVIGTGTTGDSWRGVGVSP